MGLSSSEDQTRSGAARRRARGAAAALGLALLASGCSAAEEWRGGMAIRPDQRRPQETCILAGDGEFSGRVVNYQDPELCGRWVKERGPYYVRVPRPRMSSVPQGQRNRDALGREVRAADASGREARP